MNYFDIYMEDVDRALEEFGALDGWFKKLRRRLRKAFRRLDKKVFRRIGKAFKRFGRKVGTAVERAFGYGPEVRRKIRQQAYNAVFGATWKKLGPRLVGIRAALTEAIKRQGSLGSPVAPAMLTTVLSTVSQIGVAKRAQKLIQDITRFASTELQNMLRGGSSAVENAEKVLTKMGVDLERVAVPPQIAEAYAEQFANIKDVRGKYYHAFRHVLDEIKDLTDTIVDVKVSSALIGKTYKACTDITKRLFEIPEVQSLARMRGYTPEQLSIIFAKITGKHPLTQRERQMLREIGPYFMQIRKEGKVPAWATFIVPAIMAALMVI